MRLVLAAALVMSAQVGCYSPKAQYGIPCAEGSHACPSGQECDLLTNTCQPPLVMDSWRDDTAEDFAKGDPVLADATIEPNGAIAPMPYLTGRVRYTGLPTDTIDDPATAIWSDVATGAPTGRGVGDLSFDHGTAIPPGLGQTSGDDISILIEGEIELDTAGTWRFDLQANDSGFVQLAAPGTEDFTTIISDVNGPTIASYDVATPGWYKLRAAVADSNQVISFHLRWDSPGGSMAFRDVPSDHLRSRVDDLTGYIVDGFDDTHMLDYAGATLLAQPLDLTIEPDAFGLPIGGGSWTVRWSGQILVDEAGDYAFHVQTMDGARMWIDGTSVLSDINADGLDMTTSPVTLAAGWHDVVVDAERSGAEGDGSLSVTVASGPALVGQAFPADHVRPVVGRGVRWTAVKNTGAVEITDGSSVTRTQSLDLPDNMVPLFIEERFEIDHPDLTQVSVVLDPPVGGNITLLAAGDATGAGVYSDHSAVPIADAGGTFSWIVSDSAADAAIGNLTFTALTLVCSGGIAPFPTTYRYESSVRPVVPDGRVVSLGPIRWQLRQGDTAKVYYRTCDTADACSSEPWTEVQNGAPPMVAPRDFYQYAVEITSDGNTPTALDWIEQDYNYLPIIYIPG